MGSVIKVNKYSYEEDALIKNREEAFVKQCIGLHRDSVVLDHPDGSVTVEKLSDEVKESIEQAVREAESAAEKAAEAEVNSGLAISRSAEALDVANTAKTTAEESEQRAASAEEKADAAVASAGTALEKAETAFEGACHAISEAQAASNFATEVVYTEVINHSNNADIHVTDEEKYDISRVDGMYQFLEELNDSFNVHQYNESVHTTAEEKSVWNNKTDKPIISTSADTAVSFEFSTNCNTEIRTSELTTVSFTFGDGEYAEDYIGGLSFDSGETPTAIDYTDSGILNWVGTDCATSDGLSIFQPSADTHYDIVFYFNGVQFIGLVNGFVPATGNEAV